MTACGGVAWLCQCFETMTAHGHPGGGRNLGLYGSATTRENASAPPPQPYRQEPDRVAQKVPCVREERRPRSQSSVRGPQHADHETGECRLPCTHAATLTAHSTPSTEPRSEPATTATPIPDHDGRPGTGHARRGSHFWGEQASVQAIANFGPIK